MRQQLLPCFPLEEGSLGQHMGIGGDVVNQFTAQPAADEQPVPQRPWLEDTAGIDLQLQG